MIAEKAINQRGWRFLVNLTALVRTRSAAARISALIFTRSVNMPVCLKRSIFNNRKDMEE
jgi:hypothetical protein